MERLVKIAEELGITIVALLPKSLLSESKVQYPMKHASQEEIKVEKQLHNWKDIRSQQLEEELKRIKRY